MVGAHLTDLTGRAENMTSDCCLKSRVSKAIAPYRLAAVFGGLLAVLLAGCGPSLHVVRYTPSPVPGLAVTAPTSIDVELTSPGAGRPRWWEEEDRAAQTAALKAQANGLDMTSVKRAIAADLSSTVFVNAVDSGQALSVKVGISGLDYRWNPTGPLLLGVGVGLPTFVIGEVIGLNASNSGNTELARTGWTIFGAGLLTTLSASLLPIGRVNARAHADMVISDKEGKQIAKYSSDPVVSGGYSPSGARSAWNTLFARGMDQLKAQLACDKVTLSAIAAGRDLVGRQQPRLTCRAKVTDTDGDGMLSGGERVILTAEVANLGDGVAEGVAARLTGTSKALQYLGTSRTIGDIGPGETKEAKFDATLPNRIDADNGNIIIHVSEANGFDALEEKELIVAMQPAKVTRETQVVSTLVDVDAPLEPSSFKRDDAYAVVVGISGYRSQALPKVTYARKDAEAMKDYLTSVCGFKEGNIKLLVDDGAALSDLTAYCEEWLARNVRKGSFVFAYFAGHGTPSPDKGEAYIVPYDGEPGFISKLYPLSRLYSSLASLPTDQVVVALDACFSGAGGRSVMEQGKRPLVAVDLEKETQKLGNVAVLAASAGNEISQDFDAKRHGLFTYFLLKGLRGEADADRDGWVTLVELYSYAKPKVADESQRLGYIQSPQLLPQPTGARADVRLARVR